MLSIVAAAAAFLLAALLALSSVGKRVRELGTLKALGWTQRMVVRQIAGESLAQGAIGGVLGIALGVVAALAINAFGPTLTASAATGGGIVAARRRQPCARRRARCRSLHPSAARSSRSASGLRSSAA